MEVETNFDEEQMNLSSNKNFKLIESTRRIIYFSKLSIEIEPCMRIVCYTKTIKENVLKSVLEPMKFLIKGLIYKKITSSKEKIMSLFSVMFMHYYLKYSYDLATSFEDFCDQDLLNMLSLKGISCLKYGDFKVFAYTFFYQMINELSKFNYKEVKKTFMNYSEIPQSKKEQPTARLKDYLSFISRTNIKNTMKNCMKPLIATKEKIIDMIIESKQSYKESNNSEIKSNQTIMSNETNTANFKPEVLTRRVIGELNQEELNEKEQEFTNGLAYKIDSLVDVLLSQGTHKTHNIRNFLCYIVEINSDLIRLIPEYEDIPDSTKLRVIIGARNLYFIALEAYYSVCDLYDINLNTIMQVFKTRYPFSYNEAVDSPIRVFYKILLNEILDKENSQTPEEILLHTIGVLEQEWEEEINKKSKELTFYCKA